MSLGDIQAHLRCRTVALLRVGQILHPRRSIVELAARDSLDAATSLDTVRLYIK
jgi:hypothetical protein